MDGQTVVASISDDTGGSGHRQWSASPGVGAWTRIFVDLKLAPMANVSVHLGAPGTVDEGALVASLDLTDLWISGPPGFFVGIGPTSQVGGYVLVDNIVFDAK
jgi:hypothetical protein